MGVLQYFNPLNAEWQKYIFAQENKTFEAFAFDGWHGDTIGENGPMRAADGGRWAMMKTAVLSIWSRIATPSF